ncbi:MAG: site-2 protease family protein [Candidatus Micrarchaeota archaeon]
MFGTYIERDEAVEITISVLAISLAMGIFFARPAGVQAFPIEFLLFMLPLIVTVGSGFILHEMAHKIMAIYYGAAARFHMWVGGLVFMLATSVMGAMFAAPGAVYIFSDRITRRENGLISLGGPLVNIALVAVFLALDFALPVRQFYSFLLQHGTDLSGFGVVSGVLRVWKFGASINLVLALFNMIPVFPLDGSKVFAWNKPVWMIVVGGLLALGSAIISPGIIIGFVIMLLFVTLISKLLFGWRNERR